MEHATDVFISYSHQDRAIAEHLSSVLEGYGYSVWWDHALLAGVNFRTQITEKIAESRVVLVLFSKTSINSGWVLDEAGRADQANKLIPIRVSPVAIPLGFGQLHYCDFMDLQDRSHAAMEKILLAVEHHIGKDRSEEFVIPELVKSSSNAHASDGNGKDRFRVGFLPDRSIVSIVAVLTPVYLLALLVALMISGGINPSALKEWISLLHAYTGMITLGGGIFLTVMFRLGDKAPTNTERAAIADVARKLFVVWRFAAIGQLVTGCLLAWLDEWNISNDWIFQSLVTYSVALSLWWVGFRHALRAAQYDSLYQIGKHIQDARRMRDSRLMFAMFLTGWVLVLMIYKNDAEMFFLLNKLSVAFGSGHSG